MVERVCDEAAAGFVGFLLAGGAFVVVSVLAMKADQAWSWLPVNRAEKARRKKWESYYIEYLGYGFSKDGARTRADAQMERDAQAADEATR